MSAQPPKQPRSPRVLLAANRIHEEAVTIVGAGDIGRQIALQLVALGIPKLTIIDPVDVATTEVITGGFRTDDVGRPRVDAVGEVCHQANPQLDFTGLQESFRPALFNGTTIFCCVERAATRKVIWLGVHISCRFWADAQVSGETARVFVAADAPSQLRYAAALAGQTLQSRRNQPPTVVCVAGLAASLAVHQYTRYLRGLVVVDEIEFDLLADRFEAGGFMHE